MSKRSRSNRLPPPIPIHKHRWIYIGFKIEGVFMGGVVIFAASFHDAAKRAAHYGVRGEVVGFIVDEHLTPDVKYRERLLSIEECREFEASIAAKAVEKSGIILN